MEMVLLTALGVGGATLVGSIIGFFFKNISHKFSDRILSFAAGVMLAAAVFGLVMPSLEYGGEYGIFVTILGVFAGALLLNLMDKALPHLHRLSGVDIEEHPEKSGQINKVILFVMAIAGGIALQNIPEGMVIIAPMLASGFGKRRTFVAALLTGVVGVVGTLLGYFAVSISNAILPFALAFAGGTMLYVISDEMIPETHHNGDRFVTYALLMGFSLMLLIDFYLG